MISIRKHVVAASAALAVSGFLTIAAVSGDQTPAAPVTLTAPTTPQKAPDADGFIPRWLLLEPIGVNGLTQSAGQGIVKKEYFPDQFAGS
jgi:hypothetical protein